MLKPIILFLTTLLLASLPFLASDNPKEISDKLFINYSLYFILVTFLWWILNLFKAIGQYREKIIPHLKKSNTIFSLVTALALSSLIFFTGKISFKTNSDETNLLSVSQSMAINKKPLNTVMGFNNYGNFNPFFHETPKRPLMFPFFSAIMHSIFGYSHHHPFVLNFLFLFLLLGLITFVGTLYLSKITGTSLAIATAANPTLQVYSRSAGFDVCSSFFMAISFLTFWLAKRSHHHFPIFVSTLAVFSHIRYESVIIAIILVLGYYIWPLKRPQKSELTSLALFMFLMIPHVWQRVFSAGKYENPEGIAVFSIANFLNNSKIFLSSLFDFSLYLPHPTLLFSLGLLSFIPFFIHAKRESLKPIFILSIAILAHLLIILSHHAGQFNHPTQVRLFLPFSLSLTVLFILAIIFKYKNISAQYALLGISLFAFLFYRPIATQEHFFNTLELNQALDRIYPFLENYQSKNILVIFDRPGQMTALEYGAVSEDFAQQNAGKIVRDYNNGLFEKVVIINERKYNDKRPLWFEQRGWKTKLVYFFQNTPEHFYEIREMLRNP